MSDTETTEGVVEEQIEGNEPESKKDSETGLTEEQVEKLLQERDKKWQSKFDKLLQEKKETETKSQTAEERIAEIERKYEEERIKGVRERAINQAKLDSSFVDAAKRFLSTDDESVSSGAEMLSELINSQVETRAKEMLDAEIAKRFPKGGQAPKAGKNSGELTYDDLLGMTDEQINALPDGTFERIMNNKQE